MTSWTVAGGVASIPARYFPLSSYISYAAGINVNPAQDGVTQLLQGKIRNIIEGR